MFTGIIRRTGTVRSISPCKGTARRALTCRIKIEAKGMGRHFAIGDSLAINGVCLTLIAKKGAAYSFDIIPETVRRTTLSKLKKGDKVHLERPLKAGQRVDGHYVLGHVDASGKVVETRLRGRGKDLRIAFPAKLRRYFFEKGSVAIDGVSLTIGKVSKGSFWLHLVPHTLRWTRLGRLQRGNRVNLEADMLVKTAFRRGR